MVVRSPKTRRYARYQHMEIRDSATVELLERHCRGLQPSDWLIDMTYTQLRQRFNALLKEVGLAEHKLSPSSLRTGAATSAFMRGLSLERVRYCLRHAELRTTDRYLQEAVALTVWCTVIPAQRERLLALADLRQAVLRTI